MCVGVMERNNYYIDFHPFKKIVSTCVPSIYDIYNVSPQPIKGFNILL